MPTSCERRMMREMDRLSVNLNFCLRVGELDSGFLRFQSEKITFSSGRETVSAGLANLLRDR